MRAGEQTGLVSCVIIFFNAERYLAEAVESVATQTYPHWELLLVDDGSTDRSAEVAASFAARWPDRIRILHHPGRVNQGKSASRNLGMKAARGEFLAFLDADDVWRPSKLEEQVALLRATPAADLIYGPVLYWYSWTGRPLDRFRDVLSQVGLPNGAHSRLFNAPRLLARILMGDAHRQETICPYPSSILLRRSHLASCGGFDEDFRDLYDDVVFFVKALLRGRALVVGQVWAHYRLHPDEQLSTSYQRAVAAGNWDPQAGSEAELLFLRRAKALLRGGPWRLRLQYTVRFALLRYHAPRLFQVAAGLAVWRRKVLKALRGSHRGSARDRLHPGCIDWGDFNSALPIDNRAGFSRGVAIRDRVVGEFLHEHASDIRGEVVEVGDDVLANRHGVRRLTHVEVLPLATLSAEAREAAADRPAACDCLIAVDALAYADDPGVLLAAIHRRLRPGGVALMVAPGLTPLTGLGEDRWRFTPHSARTLCERAFGGGSVQVRGFGNVKLALAGLHGLGGADLDENVWTENDPAYPVLILIAARRAAAPVNERPGEA